MSSQSETWESTNSLPETKEFYDQLTRKLYLEFSQSDKYW